MAVAAGEGHTVAVSEEGYIFSFGNNKYGQLGTGYTLNRLTPTRVAGLPGPVRQIATGRYHTGMVTEDGDLFMCGRGENGLGLGDENDRTTPTLVARALFDNEAVLMVACGISHTAVATEIGGVYTFGKGVDGMLGHGDEQDQLAPRRVPAAGFRPNGSAEGPDERVVMVATGCSHTVALSEAGHVFTWGWNSDGQLGHNNRAKQLAPRQVEAGRFGSEKVVFVAAGGDRTVAVTAGGRLYTWGYSGYGQLGHGDTDSRLVPTLVGEPTGPAFAGSAVAMAACAGGHTLVVTQDGALWVCGFGRDGQLGLNHRNDRYVFERVGQGAFGGARVVAAAAGRYISVAVTEDGALWTWGASVSGQLGHGDEERRLVPTRVAAASTHFSRIGRCLPLPTDHALAFTMCTHGRLGHNSLIRVLEGEPGLLTIIARAANRFVGGKAGELEGLIRLLGGVSADRRRHYAQTIEPGFSRVGCHRERWCRKCQAPH
tara:strand:- start:7678 stop:9135 length:1458 start_codon:yes stop_codon:yes gene_type:complete